MRTINSLAEAVEALRSFAIAWSGTRVCYTAIFGGYDLLHDPNPDVEAVDFVCFSDNRELKSDRWKIICVNFLFRDPRRTSRLFKCLPHLLFPNHQQSIWIDGNFETSGEFLEFLEHQNYDRLMCFNHHTRNCLYKEAVVCVSRGKDDAALIKAQVTEYRHKRMPENYGLISSGVLVRRHHDEKVIRLCSEWLREINEYSVRDQLAFPFVAWKQDFKYNTFPTSMTRTPGLRYRPHSKWIFYDRHGRKLLSLRSYLWGLYYRLRVR